MYCYSSLGAIYATCLWRKNSEPSIGSRNRVIIYADRSMFLILSYPCLLHTRRNGFFLKQAFITERTDAELIKKTAYLALYDVSNRISGSIHVLKFAFTPVLPRKIYQLSTPRTARNHFFFLKITV